MITGCIGITFVSLKLRELVNEDLFMAADIFLSLGL